MRDLSNDPTRNLPSVLTMDLSDPVFLQYKTWITNRCFLMTSLHRIAARGEFVTLLREAFDTFDYINEDEAKAAVIDLTDLLGALSVGV